MVHTAINMSTLNLQVQTIYRIAEHLGESDSTAGGVLALQVADKLIPLASHLVPRAPPGLNPWTSPGVTNPFPNIYININIISYLSTYKRDKHLEVLNHTWCAVPGLTLGSAWRTIYYAETKNWTKGQLQARQKPYLHYLSGPRKSTFVTLEAFSRPEQIQWAELTQWVESTLCM